MDGGASGSGDLGRLGGRLTGPGCKSFTIGVQEDEMGMFSYECKECGHPMLSPEATSEGINEWMSDAVALSRDGDRAVGTYDGYGRADGYEVGDCGMDVAWVHRACWEKAGRPEWSRYGSPSASAGDQGWFFDDGDHDLIDPRVEDEGERARLLAEGVERRSRMRHDQRARKVARMFEEREDDAPAWRRRYKVSSYENRDGALVVYAIDDLTGEEVSGEFGSLEEIESHCASLWAAFVDSEEARAYLARATEMRREAREAFLEKMRVEGRYEVSYRTVKGDRIEDGPDDELPWQGSRRTFYVVDRMTCDRHPLPASPVEELGIETYRRDPEWEGEYASEAWARRVEEVREATRREREMAEDLASRLQRDWIDRGAPWEARE